MLVLPNLRTNPDVMRSLARSNPVPPRKPSPSLHGFAGVLVPCLATLAVLVPRTVHADPPTAADFRIDYYATNADGSQGRYLSYIDMQRFLNRARCECNHNIRARVLLRNPASSTGNVRVRTYVGANCGSAQNGVNQQLRPCVKLADESANTYSRGVFVDFNPIWLASGVAERGTQDIGEATPYYSCNTNLRGEGGIWLCVENGMLSDCQQDEFIVTDTQNENALDEMPQGLSVDFEAPLVTGIRDISAIGGDGAILVNWKQDVTGDISGFRVLCADADGNPLPNKGLDPPPITRENRGDLYFTQANLCPNGPFGSKEGAVVDDEDADPDTTGGTETGNTTIAADESSSDSGTDSSTTDGGDTSTGGAVVLPEDGIESLDWAYVCTGHLAFNTNQARIGGLANERDYQFLLVAYDLSGNPIAASDVLVGRPRATTDLWEQCEAAGDVCGDGGFCAVARDRKAMHAGLPWLSLLLLGSFARRIARRRHA